MKRSSLSKSELTERRLEGRDIVIRILRMFLPAFLSSAMVYGMSLINYMTLAAFTDYTAIATYGIVSSYTNLAAGFFVPISLGAGYLLERTQKSGDSYKIQTVINSLILFSLFVGVIITVFSLLIAPGYVWQVLTPEEIKVQTTEFLRLFAFTFIPILYFSVTTTILIQSGNRTAPVLAEISGLALHASFSYIFIGLFHWDLRGIAISAIVSQIISSLITTHQVLQIRQKSISRPKIRIDWSIIKELLREERTVVFSAVLGGVFVIFLQFFIDDLGMTSIAGFTLFFMFQDLVFLPIHALRTPMRTLSAEYYEHGGNKALIRVVNPILMLAMLYSLALIPWMRLVGPSLFMHFSHNAEVVTVSMRLVKLVSSYYVFYAISLLLSSSLDGLGKKTLTMNLNSIFNYLIRFLVLLLAALLIQGDESIAICYPVSWAIASAVLVIYYFATYSASRKFSI